jgi:putative addiction module killer protein
MDVVERELKVFVSEEDISEFEEWYENIRDKPTHMRVRARLTRVQNGNFGDHKIFSGGIGELRLDFGPGYRVYFVQEGATIVFLLAGGDKSTQLVDIQNARRLWEGNQDENKRLQRDLRL